MSKENQEVLLKVEHLCQYFKMGKKWLKAVDDVSFDIKKGEVLGLVGESGCGKTTTGRSIIKLYDITSGNIWFDGHRIGAGIMSYKQAISKAKAQLKKTEAEQRAIKKADASKAAECEKAIAAAKENCANVVLENRKNIANAKYDNKNCDKIYASENVKKIQSKYEALYKSAPQTEIAKLKAECSGEISKAKKERLVTKIQMIFQDPIASLNPRMTVKEIIAEGLVINGVKNKKYIEEQVYSMLELVGLVRDHAGRYPHEFSGGQRQRIGIARSIVLSPEMIIADEPVSALDVSIQAQVINLLNDLRNKFGLTILFIAHDLSVVKYFSDRIAVMYFGNMVELASSDELFAHPLHPYTRSLLSAIPIPNPDVQKNKKRISYNAIAEHDYSEGMPTLREIAPGHFVRCNDAEERKYLKELEAEAEIQK